MRPPSATAKRPSQGGPPGRNGAGEVDEDEVVGGTEAGPQREHPGSGGPTPAEGRLAEILVGGRQGPVFGPGPGRDVRIGRAGADLPDPGDVVPIGPQRGDDGGRHVLISKSSNKFTCLYYK